MLGFFFYSPIVPILFLGAILAPVQWILSKLTGRQVGETAAWTAIVLAVIVIVDVGLSLGG